MCFRRSVILPPYRTDICNILHLASSCFSKVSRNDASLSFFHLPAFSLSGFICLCVSQGACDNSHYSPFCQEQRGHYKCQQALL